MDTKLIELNKLSKDIDDLKYFIIAIDGKQKISSANGFKHIIANIKIITTRRMQLYANRYFGLGSHTETIDIPDSLFQDIISLAEKRLKMLKKEYDDKLNNKNL